MEYIPDIFFFKLSAICKIDFRKKRSSAEMFAIQKIFRVMKKEWNYCDDK